MKQKTIRELVMVCWALLLILNLISMLHNPTIISYLLVGFSGGFLLHLIIVHPLLTSSENLINLYSKISDKMRELNEKKVKKK